MVSSTKESIQGIKEHIKITHDKTNELIHLQSPPRSLASNENSTGEKARGERGDLMLGKRTKTPDFGDIGRWIAWVRSRQCRVWWMR